MAQCVARVADHLAGAAPSLPGLHLHQPGRLGHTRLGLGSWAHLPATSTLLIFLVLEVLVFAQLLTRLWQLSSAMTWYQRHPDAIPVEVVEVVEVMGVAPAPPETVEPPPLPPGDPGPELPPADA